MTRQTGRRLLRAEDPAFLNGSALYTADISYPRLQDALFVEFVRSPFAHALIVSVDTSAAQRAVGVHSVLTGQDVAHLPPLHLAQALPDSFAPPILASSDIRFAGQAVAAVLAASPELAADGAELVEVEYDPLDPILGIEQALQLAPLEQTRL